MVVCIMNRVPLIVVGKPGSSKTLAMMLIRDAFSSTTKAPAWETAEFKDMEMFPYQCSKHSTADGIEKRFTDAKRFQDRKGEALNSVVFLDEVGLAEESKAMPLKVLHKLLEKPEVSFVGLSNWDLDPAKMNRAVYLLRPDAKTEDLRDTAVEIVKGTKKEANHILEAAMRALTQAYLDVDQLQAERGYGLRGGGHFIGLRDFYNFVKLLDRKLRRTDNGVMTAKLLVECILRSFGGYRNADIVPIVCRSFYNQMEVLRHACPNGPEQMLEVVGRLELIGYNLTDLPTEEEQGSRHLMVLSDHESALQVLIDKGIVDIKAAGGDGSVKAKIIHGSHFAGDRSTLTMYRTISTIKNCMEAGITVVLMHLDEIYESLYDMLNQSYTRGVAGGMFCRLAIGARSRQCEVHPEFRCIVVVDSERAYGKLPSPLLNRFEKQCLSRSDVLEGEFKEAEAELWDWCEKVAKIMVPDDGVDLAKRSGIVSVLAGVFVGFNGESLASILLTLQEGTEPGRAEQIAAEEKAMVAELSKLEHSELAKKARDSGTIPSAIIANIGRGAEQGVITMLANRGAAVRVICRKVQDTLVWWAAPEAVVKYSWLKGRGLDGKASTEHTDQSSVNMAEAYFERQQHQSLWTHVVDATKYGSAMRSVVLTFSDVSVDLVSGNKDGTGHLCFDGVDKPEPGSTLAGATWDVKHLASFSHAADFREHMQKFYAGDTDGIVVQCGLATSTSNKTVTGPQIHHAKQMAVEEAPDNTPKHVIFVVHLIKDQSVEGVMCPFNFHAEKDWRYVTIDALEKPHKQGIPAVQELLLPSVTALFGEDMGASDNELTQAVLGSSLRRCLSQLVYPPEVRDDLTIQEKLKLLEGVLKDGDFIGSVMRRVHKVFTKTAEEQMREGWQAVLERGRIAGAGCYRKALFNKVAGSVTEGFTRLLAAIDGNDNLRLFATLTVRQHGQLGQVSAEERGAFRAQESTTDRRGAGFISDEECEPLRDVWLKLAEDENLVPLASAQAGAQGVFEVISPKTAKAFQAQYPFSMQLIEQVESLRQTAVELAYSEGGRVDVWKRLGDLVNASQDAVGLIGNRKIGLLAYLEDFARLHIPPTVGDWTIEEGGARNEELAYLEISKAFILRTAMDRTGLTREGCLVHIADIHCAYAQVHEVLSQAGDLIRLLPADITSSLIDYQLANALTPNSGRKGVVKLVLLVLETALSSLKPDYALKKPDQPEQGWGEWMGSLFSTPAVLGQQVYEDYVRQVSQLHKSVVWLMDWCNSYAESGGEDDADSPLEGTDAVFSEARQLALGDLEEKIKEGWVTVQGHKVRNWRKRWCVVTLYKGKRFFLYYQKDKPEKTPLGMLVLESMPVVKASRDPTTFEVSVNESSHGQAQCQMRVDFPQEREAWMEAIVPASERGSAAPERGSAAPEEDGSDSRALEVLEKLRESDLVGDHKQMFTHYPASFSASAAVDWMIDGLHAKDKQAAVELGQRLVQLGKIEHVTDKKSSFRDKNTYFHFVEAGRRGSLAPDLELAGDTEHLRRLEGEWRRARMFADCVKQVFLPLHASLQSGVSLYNDVLEGALDLGSFNLLVKTVNALDSTVCDPQYEEKKDEVCARFGERFLSENILARRPRMATLKFVVKVCAYEGEKGYKKDVDSVLKNRSDKPAITAATRVDLMRQLLQFTNPADGADPLRDGIDARARKMINRQRTKIDGDNVANLILSQVMQDRLMSGLRDLGPQEANAAAAEIGNEALQRIEEMKKQGFQLADKSAFAERNIVDWLLAVAQARLVIEHTVDTVVSWVEEKRPNSSLTRADVDLCRATSQLLELGIVPGQHRALQIYFFKQLDRKMGMQASVQFIMSDMPQTLPKGLMELKELHKELQLMSQQGSAIMPNLDPFIHIFKNTAYRTTAQAMRVCATMGAQAGEGKKYAELKATLAGGDGLPHLMGATFREVYLRHGGPDAVEHDTSWLLQLISEESMQGSAAGKEFAQKLATNQFDHSCMFHLTRVRLLDTPSFVWCAQPFDCRV